MSEEMINGMDIAALAAQAAAEEDFTKTSSGDFEKELIPEGPCFVRLREYIELGKQKQAEWAAKAFGAKPPKPKARWVFEVVAAVRKRPDGHEQAGERYNAARREITPEGKDPFTIAETIAIETDIGKNAKSGHIKLFKALNAPYGGQYTHPAQLLDCEGWKARIIHSYAKDDKDADGNPKDGAKPSYQNLKGEQGYTFEAPVKEDPETGDVTRIKVPELCDGPGSRKIFLWNQPNQACWDSLFIEGTRTVKDKKGNEEEKSKNWLQEKILGATDYAGSPLSLILEGSEDLEKMADAAVTKPDADEDPLADLD